MVGRLAGLSRLISFSVNISPFKLFDRFIIDTSNRGIKFESYFHIAVKNLTNKA